MGDVNAREEEFSHFCELPNDLTEDILAWLPAKYLCVSKEWNTLFSSARFITTQWAEAPPHKNALLLVGGVDYNWNCFAHSCFTRNWKASHLPLSFLEIKEGAAQDPLPFRYLASGAGLFLIEGTCTNSIYVCNPLTGKGFTLIPLRFRSMGVIGVVQEGEDGYKVVVVHTYRMFRRKIVEIYDSTDKAWRMAGVLQENLSYLNVKEYEQIVFSGLDFFYCLMVSDTVEGIMCFNMREGTSTFVPLPAYRNDANIFFSHLVNCGSRILLVEGMEMETETQAEEEVVLWEYKDDAGTKWEPIVRMPPTVFSRRHDMEDLQCAGMGDCVYFKIPISNEVAVYNLTQNSWTMLPNCPGPIEIFVAFTPRPDMKVN